jgi:hypothetical protein
MCFGPFEHGTCDRLAKKEDLQVTASPRTVELQSGEGQGWCRCVPREFDHHQPTETPVTGSRGLRVGRSQGLVCNPPPDPHPLSHQPQEEHCEHRH